MIKISQDLLLKSGLKYVINQKKIIAQILEAKERLFHQFTSNFPNRNSFWQKLHMKPTLQKISCYNEGLPRTGHYDAANADQ